MKIDQTKKNLKRLPLVVAKHTLLVCLILLLLALVSGSFLYYKYYILAQKMELEISGRLFPLKEEVYREVLNVWQENEIVFREAEFKKYPDPFKKPISAPKANEAKEVPGEIEELTE